MSRVQHHRGAVTMMEDLTVRPHGGRGHHVRMTSNMAIEHGACDTAGAGLLHPVWDVQEVRIVLRVRGMIRGPGESSSLVTVRGAASALSVLVISEIEYYYYFNVKYKKCTRQYISYFKSLKPAEQRKDPVCVVSLSV